MTPASHAKQSRIALCCIAATLGALVTQAGKAAEVQGRVEVGLGHVALDEPNSKYGEYTGIRADDSYLIGEVDASVEDGAAYLELQAADLGLDYRNVKVAAGKYGIYSLAFGYDEIPHLVSVGDRSPFGGVGTDRLTLPAGFVRAATTSGMSTLAGSLQTVDLRTDRQEKLFRVSRHFAGGWQAELSLRREDKDGLQSLGALTAQNAGQADSTILPQPVDYRTEEFAVSLAFNGEGRQVELGYFLSLFHNGHTALTWDVPFLKAAPAALDYPAVARISLPPDNKYQRISLSGGVNLPRASRLSVVLDLGRMSQDDALLPYSTDEIGGTAALREDGQALPRAGADAEIDVVHATVNLVSQPLPRLGVNARYRFYQTDNKTAYTLFDRVINDTVAQSATEDLYSRPYDYTLSRFDLGANYRFPAGWRLQGDYGREVTGYDRYRSVKEVVEDSLRAVLSRNFTDTLDGRLGYTHGRRVAERYDAFISYSTLIPALSCPSLVTVNPDPDTGGSTTIDTCFSNHPDLRQYDLASRDRNSLTASLVYTPSPAVDIGLDFAGRRDVFDDDIAFDDTYLGLTADDSVSMTLDIAYTPEAPWSVSGYYTRERLSSSQSGRAFGGAAAAAINSSLNWEAEFDDEIDTVGVAGSLDLLYDSLRLTMAYAYTREAGRIRFATGSGVTSEDMPRDGSKRHAVDINAVYRLSDTLGVGLGVGYERFKSRDWSLDSVEAGGTVLNDVLLLSGPLEDYAAYALRATLIYAW